MHTPLPAAAGVSTLPQLSDFWPRLLAVLHAELGERRYRMWIAPLKLKSVDAARVELLCPTPFHRSNVQERFADRIAALIELFSRQRRAVAFVCGPQPRDPQASVFDVATPFSPSAERRISVEHIKKRVTEKYNLNPGDLESRSRKRELVRPRQIAMYAARKLSGQSFPQISRRFGPRDHSTVVHGCDVVEARIAREPEFAAELEELFRSIRDTNPS